MNYFIPSPNDVFQTGSNRFVSDSLCREDISFGEFRSNPLMISPLANSREQTQGHVVGILSRVPPPWCFYRMVRYEISQLLVKGRRGDEASRGRASGTFLGKAVVGFDGCVRCAEGAVHNGGRWRRSTSVTWLEGSIVGAAVRPHDCTRRGFKFRSYVRDPGSVRCRFHEYEGVWSILASDGYMR
jgi:hypothetical protein